MYNVMIKYFIDTYFKNRHKYLENQFVVVCSVMIESVFIGKNVRNT